jgi:hypothetical protein
MWSIVDQRPHTSAAIYQISQRELSDRKRKQDLASHECFLSNAFVLRFHDKSNKQQPMLWHPDF